MLVEVWRVLSDGICSHHCQNVDVDHTARPPWVLQLFKPFPHGGEQSLTRGAVETMVDGATGHGYGTLERGVLVQLRVIIKVDVGIELQPGTKHVVALTGQTVRRKG